MQALNRPADEFVNDQLVEELWAMKAYQHSEIYFNLISSVADPSQLKLTATDQDIYDKFREAFPQFPVGKFEEEDLKSPAAKESWRTWCGQFEATVQDFNYATLLRLDSAAPYSESNTCVVPRIQFLAIEIARNREHANDGIKDHMNQTKD